MISTPSSRSACRPRRTFFAVESQTMVTLANGISTTFWRHPASRGSHQRRAQDSHDQACGSWKAAVDSSRFGLIYAVLAAIFAPPTTTVHLHSFTDTLHILAQSPLRGLPYPAFHACICPVPQAQIVCPRCPANVTALARLTSASAARARTTSRTSTSTSTLVN